jgi:hypothetical protein
MMWKHFAVFYEIEGEHNLFRNIPARAEWTAIWAKDARHAVARFREEFDNAELDAICITALIDCGAKPPTDCSDDIPVRRRARGR